MPIADDQKGSKMATVPLRAAGVPKDGESRFNKNFGAFALERLA